MLLGWCSRPRGEQNRASQSTNGFIEGGVRRRQSISLAEIPLNLASGSAGRSCKGKIAHRKFTHGERRKQRNTQFTLQMLAVQHRRIQGIHEENNAQADDGGAQ